MTAFAIYFNHPLEYKKATAIQETLVAARIAGKTPDVVLFLEHEPVITMGVRASESHITLSAKERVNEKSIQIVQTSRGGGVTWHGPGQLVMYPIIKLGEKEADAHGYLHNLEEIAIRTAKDFNLSAFRRKGLTGAWTHNGKLAAIGIRFKHWVTFHGMSFNVNPDMSGFENIIPCGLKGESVTSLDTLLKQECPSMADVRKSMARHFSKVCGRNLQQYSSMGTNAPTELTQIIAPFTSTYS